MKFILITGLFLAPLVTLHAAETANQTKPNILWLVCEDSSVSWFGCYGNASQLPRHPRLLRVPLPPAEGRGILERFLDT